MLRMTVWYYHVHSTMHNVYCNGRLIGNVGVYGYRLKGVCEPYRNVFAHFSKDKTIKQFETVTSAVKWLVVKEAMHNV